ncbi:hypothetical protein BBJ29_007277 [Phytophthora kernoviae]|uniref:Arrestin-like N-terminal domain-containing protein n=1 Tax=Phytophthora kernoviae TaxID=325452 RepID=A0A3F2RU79_9STRA|nr:hypothetical protein BBP00_00003480 [Phytophthora kernoviae]RLN70983.1 hypothetical protein BBJ29_007277 [Phytophthora kernoviae]
MGKKATLRLELDRESYQVGDVVNGTVYLSVSDEIKSKAALVLEVNGEEYVKYNEVYGEVAVPHKQIHKLMGDQIVLCDDRQAYAPGEYVYPFNYQLNPTLPGSFHVNHRHAGEICDIDAAVKYELKLRLPLKGVFNSDLKLDQPLKIRASQAMAYPVQTQSGSTVQHAKLLGVIRQGNCELSGTLDRDAYIAGDTLQIRCAISNGSSMEARSVSVRLYEDLVIHKNSDHEDIKAQTCLVKKDFPGLSAGASLDQVLSLDLVGRQLWLELERVTYHAGDVVQGAIRLSVNEKFHCDGGLVLEINGSETIAWIQRVGKRGHLPRHKRSTILQQQQQVSCGHETFSPGEYVYPFAYKLHSKLPGSFQFFNGGTGNMWDICV